MRRALLFGSSGQLGSELLRANWPAGWKIEVAPFERFDFTRPAELEELTVDNGPAAILNAAAYTAVDKAESEPQLAECVNATAPHALARAAARLDVPLLHVSTDYVFDGELEGRDYLEDDAACPLSVYGRTKWAGEELVRATAGKHVIVRTSWVFSPFGGNFVKTMIRLARERHELRVVDDQTGKPTYAGGLAKALLTILGASCHTTGTFHYTGDTAMTWCALAGHVFRHGGRHGQGAPRLLPISTTDYPTPARRPRNSRLGGTKLADAYGIHPHDFESALHRCMDELMEKQ